MYTLYFRASAERYTASPLCIFQRTTTRSNQIPWRFLHKRIGRRSSGKRLSVPRLPKRVLRLPHLRCVVVCARFIPWTGASRKCARSPPFGRLCFAPPAARRIESTVAQRPVLYPLFPPALLYVMLRRSRAVFSRRNDAHASEQSSGQLGPLFQQCTRPCVLV